MAKKKKNTARAAGTTVVLGLEISAQHKEGIDTAAEREQRSKRVILERALEAYFRSTGVWPAKPE